jgi:hypothetical protein
METDNMTYLYQSNSRTKLIIARQHFFRIFFLSNLPVLIDDYCQFTHHLQTRILSNSSI